MNGGAAFDSVPMTADGEGFSAEIPGQAAGTIVQFYVEAADAPGAISLLPAGGAASRALYLVDDGAGTALSAHELRVIMLPADSASLLAPLNRLSDARLGATAISRRVEVFYDAGVRLQGTAAGRIRDGEDYPGYDVTFPADHLFRGVHDNVNIDRSGRSPVVRGQDEIYVKHLFNRAGIPCTYDDLTYFISPTGIHTGTVILQMAGYGSTFVDAQFGGEGTVFNLDGTYEPGTTTNGNPESLKNPVPLATQLQSDFENRGADKEQYRGFLEPRAGRRADDFSGLIPFCQTMSLPNAQLAAQIGARMDVDEWMRCAALYSLCGIEDCYMNGGFRHNLRVWVPGDGLGVVALPWDMDFVFLKAATAPAILATGNLRRVIDQSAAARRAYYGHLHDLCNTVFTAAYMNRWLAHYGSVAGQGMSGRSSYIEARRASVLSQLPAQVSFEITTNGGMPFSVNAGSTTLAGNGWIDIREFRRADTGATVEATWTGNATWELPIALREGINEITIETYDFQGALLDADSITITNTLPAADPRDALRIAELMYHPAAPTGAETAASTNAEDFEFIELQNLGTDPLEIGGCKFTAGVDFVFPANTTLLPGERICVVRHPAAFEARYGNGPRVAGAYSPGDALSNSGETITLVDALGAVIESFTYGEAFPWPANADGEGFSLVAIGPQLGLDRDRGENWRASAQIGGSAGGGDATSFSGIAGADIDHDGKNAFLEYALGSSDAEPEGVSWRLEPDGQNLLLSFSRRLTADDTVIAIEAAAAIGQWASADALLFAREFGPDSLVETWRITPPESGAEFFLRLRASLRDSP